MWKIGIIWLKFWGKLEQSRAWHSTRVWSRLTRDRTLFFVDHAEFLVAVSLTRAPS